MRASRTRFDLFCTESRSAVEGELENILDECPSSAVNNVARYVTLGGGHRWRAVLVLAGSSLVRRQIPSQAFLRCACAMELYHAASLVLDDLPSMDDARFRRGKPCAHCVFPLWAVDMVPPYLIAVAHSVLLSLPGIPAPARNEIARQAGTVAVRMSCGQEKDLLGPGKGLEEIMTVYREKTGALFGLSAACPLILAGKDPAPLLEFGETLGVAYQLMDDFADMSSDLPSLGKNPGQDADKTTLLEQAGVMAAEDILERCFAQARSLLQTQDGDTGMLEHFTFHAMHVELPG